MKGKKVLKGCGFTLLVLLGVVLLAFVAYQGYFWWQARSVQALLGEEAPTLSEDGYSYRDLNKNGQLDGYEDGRLTDEERVEDLLAQMTLEEKAGMMFLTMISTAGNGDVVEKMSLTQGTPTSEMIGARMMNHFTLMSSTTDAQELARWNNDMQKLAERTRLGIPLSLQTDPRSEAANINPFIPVGTFAMGPYPLGFGALNDADLMYEFADNMRQEYLAVGLRVAQHPQADLATEPRWSRMHYTFGEDADIAADMVDAYIRGLQGDELGSESVAAMVKHWPGAGPQREGGDAHFEASKDQAYPSQNLDYHLIPFEAAFEAGTAAVMPYYATPGEMPFETVGFAFNEEIINGLLRDEHGFDGVVTTDFGVVAPMKTMGIAIMPAAAWGVEELTIEERLAKAMDAGVDQIGGADFPHRLVTAVEQGLVDEARLDESVRRLLLVKFQLGLFDDPYVDAAAAAQIVNQPAFKAIGDEAQRRSMVLLENRDEALPLAKQSKIYVENVDPQIAAQYGTVVDKPEDADFAILRLASPSSPAEEEEPAGDQSLVSRFLFSSGGSLEYTEEEKTKTLELLDKVPTIVVMRMERPGVIPEIAAASTGLLVEFGVTDDAVLDVVFGDARPEGRLPVEMPSSMEAVEEQHEDVPYDSENPLYPFGYGLSYAE